MKSAELIEGPEAYQRFENAMLAVLAVARAIVQRRIEEHRKQADLSPRKSGPKRKAKPAASASHDPAA